MSWRCTGTSLLPTFGASRALSTLLASNRADGYSSVNGHGARGYVPAKAEGVSVFPVCVPPPYPAADVISQRQGLASLRGWGFDVQAGLALAICSLKLPGLGWLIYSGLWR